MLQCENNKNDDRGGGGCRRRGRGASSTTTITIWLYVLVAHTLLVAVAQACTPTGGTYCPSPGGDAVTCPAGYFCTGDVGDDHTPCPVGTANGLTGQSSGAACHACTGSTVASATGMSACTLCAAGTIYTGVNTCSACLAGTYAHEGDATCTACDAGYSSIIGAGACSQCRPGSFAQSTGSSACTSCPTNTYTFTGTLPSLSVLWGATAVSQCVTIPTSPATPLVCLPGTRMIGSACVTCPIGYYCPSMSVYASTAGQIRACPSGTSTATTGAIATGDCGVAGPLLPFTFAGCAITPGDVTALTSLNVRAMTATLDASAVYFATATAVYRLFLQSNTLELIAGAEGVTGAAVNAVGVLARFTAISAIAVDLDYEEATVVVVGDGASMRVINVYTRQVSLLGATGDITLAGGIALRRDPTSGARLAYVTDSVNNRIEYFSVDQPTQNRVLVAGDIGGDAGLVNAYGASALFNVPMGLAFLERSLNQSRTLLVADSGNGVIRVVDAVTRVVRTWFQPLDTLTPELLSPVSVAVSSQNTIVYVADTGTQRVGAIQYPIPSDYATMILTTLTPIASASSTTFYIAAIPYGTVVQGSGDSKGYSQLLVLDGETHTLDALVEDLLANSADGGGSTATCHLPCAVSGCTALSAAALCGNGFLDAGEICDDPRPGSGCHVENCTLRVGYACPGGDAHCLNPCPAFVYAFTGVAHCAADCAALTPRAGYSIDAQCVETDIDECALNTDNCDAAHGMCVNAPSGSFTCSCFDGYFGDGLACHDVAYAVYTVVDIASISSSSLAVVDPITTALMDGFRAAYATTLGGNIPSNLIAGSFVNQNALQLAGLYASYSLDPVYANTSARLEIVTLFETNALALTVAAATTNAALQTALSQSLFGTSTGVVVVQTLKVRTHHAASFMSPLIEGGWGMNITSVTYNRTCALESPLVEGWSVPPAGGCWQVEMMYIGGRALAMSDQSEVPVEQTKNVLYLPRIERNSDTLEALIPSQTLTMSTGSYFPCDVTGTSASNSGVIGLAATACCLRNFEAKYRPSSAFAPFLASTAYNNAVGACTRFNDTYPQSNVVSTLPSTMGGIAGLNDLVVGHIEGMPSSEVRLVDTIDYTTRSFRVLLVLEEGDLRKHASMAQGVTGLDYSMSFFVGLANFKGTPGSSILTTRNARQLITVSKTNELTVSTFGANQDPLLTSENLQLTRIKVSDFFNPVQYLYYLQITFTLPTNFQAPPSGEVVPLNSIRLIKLSGGQTAGATSSAWQQVCASLDGNYIYADTALQTLVSRAQSEDCVQSDLQMCYPPSRTSSVVSFGLPLPIGFLTSADFEGATTGNPSSIEVQLVVQSYDNALKTNILSTLSLAVELSALGYTAVCESTTADQTLADIIDGSIYVGTATNDYEWLATVQKQTTIQVPGVVPANSLEFASTTVQGATMTFAALGSAAYFEDARYHGQTVNMHDIFTVHFLEPLSGVVGDPTPHFDAVKTLFFEGRAFSSVVDPMTHNMWLVPTAALLNICPYAPTVGKMACLTRIDSTFAGNTLTRSNTDVVELRINDPSSISELQGLMAQILFEGGANDFTRQLGSGFYTELVSQLTLNNRYRKAYVINPVMNWQMEAIQSAQPGTTAYTVATKIIGIGLITISSASGQQLGRRLLSTLSPDSFLAEEDFLPPPIINPESAFTTTTTTTPTSLSSSLLLDEITTTTTFLRYEEDDTTSITTMTTSSMPGGGRRLLQSNLEPTTTSTSNSLVMNINAPGYDAVTQLCPGIGADSMASCRMLQYTVQVSGARMEALCTAYNHGTLGTILHDGFRSSLLPDNVHSSNVSNVLLAEFTVSGCNSGVGPYGRRLLGNDLVIVISKVLIHVSGSTYTIIDPARLSFIQFFSNATIMQQLLGGSATILPPRYDGLIAENDNYNATVNITLIIANVSAPKGPYNLSAHPEIPLLSNGDYALLSSVVVDDAKNALFTTDGPSSSPKNSSASRIVAFGLHLLVLAAGLSALTLH